MVSGYPPFVSNNSFELYQSILKGKIIFPRKISTSVQSVIKGFLTIDRKKRLGCMRDGIQSLYTLPYFKNVNWVAVSELQIVPPIKPIIINDGDTSNFDSYPDEKNDEIINLNQKDRILFDEFDIILGRRSRI
jgi:serine/threonine protein kinase